MNIRTFISFCAVGAIGFCVDAGLLWVLTAKLGYPPLPARLPSFLCAVTVTWLLNSYITFSALHYSFLAWLRYLSANSAGFFLNYLIFALLNGMLGFSPVIAVSIASAVALIFNFVLNSKLVFKRNSLKN